ncbi:MAG: hypothetical protein JRH15_01975 [Deltaproteobacteria bacterium]|nr:hypothetical protein [Deltaproteobacteria bacterium]
MKDLLVEMAKSLVDNPEQVKVVEVKGRNAQAMRTILTSASGKLKKTIVLEIIE